MALKNVIIKRKIYKVKIGDTAAAFMNMKSALVIGLACGLIESRIGVNVYKKAVDLIGDWSRNKNIYRPDEKSK